MRQAEGVHEGLDLVGIDLLDDEGLQFHSIVLRSGGREAQHEVAPVDEGALHVALLPRALLLAIAHLLVATEPAAAQLVRGAGGDDGTIR